MKFARRALLAMLVFLALGAVSFYGLGRGWLGRPQPPGDPVAHPVPPEVVHQRSVANEAAARARGIRAPKQILFGDLHVHTTYSIDAFFLSLPLVSGDGARPPADACDFARYCSGLDFWSINDHAEGLTAAEWRSTVESIRQCNAIAGDPANPDVVAFLGWEWSQIGSTPENHFGHKNVVLRDLDDALIPRRPIGARSFVNEALRESPPGTVQLALLTLGGRERRYQDFARFVHERLAARDCPDGVPVRDLPDDCLEQTNTPGELFAKLDDWGHEAMVIPHGTTWGFYTPAGSTWDKQLSRAQHDPKRQFLFEIFSGHGNSEEYRNYQAVHVDEVGGLHCPEPRDDYLPSCWQAGEIIRRRCAGDGLPHDACEARAAEARQHYVEAWNLGHLTVPGVEVHEWLDSGQCRDCYRPAFNYRPGGSAQYVMALRNFEEGSADAGVDRFRFGFMASSDNHTARPGTGYKEYARREMTEGTGVIDEVWRERLGGPFEAPVAQSHPVDVDAALLNGARAVESERQASFFMTGGLVAVHSDGRDRNSIWDGMQRREVYGTSGERILLWFDLLNPPGGAAPGETLPMGSEVVMVESPRFQVRAVGSFEQAPGCPEHSMHAVSSERLERLCRGECYHPTERRKIIERIEVVRIWPQSDSTEPVQALIADPWLVLPCRPDPAGCTVTFEDPDFGDAGRDAVYYVRAIQEPRGAVNAGGLRCDVDDRGRCLAAKPCYGDYRTQFDDDCLSESDERAWSSPIFVDYAAPRP